MEAHMLVSRLRRGRAPGQYAQGGVYLRRGGSLTGGSASAGQRAVWAATAARGSAAADARHEPSGGAAAAAGGGGGGGVAAALSGGTPSGPLRSKFAVLQRLPAGYEDAAALLSSPSPSLRSAASATAASAAPAPKPLRADILGVRQPQRGNAMSLFHRRALRQQAFLAGVPPSPCSPRRPLPHYRTGHSVWGAKKPRKAQSTASQYARKK